MEIKQCKCHRAYFDNPFDRCLRCLRQTISSSDYLLSLRIYKDRIQQTPLYIWLLENDTKLENPPHIHEYHYICDDDGIIGDRSVKTKKPKVKKRRTKYQINIESWIYNHSFCKICDNERIVCGGESKCKYKYRFLNKL